MASFFSSFKFMKWSPTALLSEIRNFTSPFPSKHSFDDDDTSLKSSASFSLSSSSSASSSEIDHLRLIFNLFDENKDGSVSRDELRRSLHMLGIETEDSELLAMVEAADSNHDGLLDFSEFVSFYYDLNEGLSRKISGFEFGKTQEEGDLQAAEDVRSAKQEADDATNYSEEERNLRDAFELFDKNSDGFICAEELQSVLNSMGLKQGKLLSVCRDMIRSVDVDGDGQVSFHEFKQMMQLDLIR